jgi:hypothetical protein
MGDRRKDWKRPALALAALGALTVAVLASPVSADFEPAHEKKHVKKIARRIAKKEAKTIVQTTVGPTLFVEETELLRSGPVTANVGETKTILEAGGFRWELRCTATTTFLDLENVSGGNDSHLDDNLNGPEENDLDNGETEQAVNEDTTDNSMENGAAAVFGTAGAGTTQYALHAVLDQPATGFGGADCVAFVDLTVSG